MAKKRRKSRKSRKGYRKHRAKKSPACRSKHKVKIGKKMWGVYTKRVRVGGRRKKATRAFAKKLSNC